MMNNVLVTVFCATVILASGCSTLQNSDSATLQGGWKGREMGRPTGDTCSLQVIGNALEFRVADANEWYKGTFTLREETSPRQFIGIITECSAPQYIGKTVYAIYRIEADTLTLTGNEPGNPEVPASFDAPGSRTFVLTKP